MERTMEFRTPPHPMWTGDGVGAGAQVAAPEARGGNDLLEEEQEEGRIDALIQVRPSSNVPRIADRIA